VKRKDRSALLADRTSLVTGAGGMRSVFDHGDAVPVGQRIQRVEIECSACVMHRHDRLGSLGDGLLYQRGAGHQGVTVDIDKHRSGSQQADHVGCRHPGLRRRNHFIARPYAQRQQRNVHCPGGRRQCHCMLRADPRGELFLQLLTFRASGDPSGAQHARYRSNFFIANGRP